jgi:DNA polymerase-3 subunit beta
MKLDQKKLFLVGTDSYRLSEYTMSVDTPSSTQISCIIPARFLEELKGVIALSRGKTDALEESGTQEKKEDLIDIHLGSQQIEVTLGSTRLISRLIEGKFPDYTQVLPKERHTLVSVSVKDLLSAVKRMHYFAKEQSNNITFSFTKDGVHLMTRQTQLGQDESSIVAAVDGKDTKIAISSTYLIDFLSRIENDTIIIELSDKMHPAVFKIPGADSYLHLIMPLRMIEE